MSDKNEEQKRLLVVVLAATDALWTPCRMGTLNGRAVIWKKRQTYLEGGVAWRPGDVVPSRGPSGRQRANRAFNEAEACELVTAWSAGNVRRVGVRLTLRGEMAARKLVGMPSPAQTRYRFNTLKQCVKNGRFWSDDQWVRETWMVKADYDQSQETSDALYAIEEDLVPLLARGVVESNASIGGHVWYRAVKDEAPDLRGKMPSLEYPIEPSEDWSEFYSERLNLELEQLAAMKPDSTDKDVGLIPLPEGVGAELV